MLRLELEKLVSREGIDRPGGNGGTVFIDSCRNDPFHVNANDAVTYPGF